MADWDTRLVVTYDDGGPGGAKEISPIDSFTPTFALNAEVLHSVEQTHLGVVYSPQTLSFSMTVRAIGDVAAKLTALALSGQRFEVALKEKDGDDWGFQQIVMSDCVITSATPSTATIQGAPTATFSGFSLRSKADTKASGSVTVP
jgi:hypothetical protein